MISPLAAISAWLRQQDTETQSEIAQVLTFLMFDDQDHIFSQSPVAQRQKLLDWLSDEGCAPYKVIGRAIMLKACLEYFGNERFDEAGWGLSEEMFRSTIAEAEADSNSDAARVADSAKRMLSDLPARKAKWLAIEKSWAALAEKRLSPDALKDWSLAHMKSALDLG
jgi:hypothetical protein